MQSSSPIPQTRLQLQNRTVFLSGAHGLFALLLLYSLAFATHFSFRFGPIAALDHYQYQANGFAHFRLDAHDAAGRPIAPGCLDCINFGQHAYLPYGPFPALFQLLLVHVLQLGTTSEAIVWALCATTLYASFWVVQWYLRNVLALPPTSAIALSAVFAAVTGTTDLYLHTSTIPYAWSQASATAQLCLLFSAFFFMKALLPARSVSFNLACSGAFCGLAALSKQNYLFSCGAGIATLLWIALNGKRAFRQTARQMVAFLLPVLLCVGIMLWFNQARFGSPFDTGMDYVNATPGHLTAFQRPQLHRIPYNFYNHFLAGIEVRSSDFPFVTGKSSSFGGMNLKDGSGGLLHNWPIFSMFISVPMLLAVIPGSIWLLWRLAARPNSREFQFGIYLLLLSACTFAYFLTADSSWVRYQYDILFPMALLALQILVYAWRAIRRAPAGLPRILLQTGFSIVLLLAFAEQAALGLDQTLGLTLAHGVPFVYWSVTERASDIALKRRAQAMRSLLFDGPPTVVVTAEAKPVPRPQPAGSVWLVTASNTAYGSDGVEWTPLATLPSLPPLLFTIVFPLHAGNGTEPVVEVGKPPAADALGIHYLPGQRLQFQYDHWGFATCLGSALPYEPGSSHAFSLQLNNAAQRAMLQMDGSPVLDCGNGVYPQWSSKPVWGVNQWGFITMLPTFSGTIIPQNENPPKKSAKEQQWHVSVAFPPSHAAENEPLVQFGTGPGAGDLLGVTYLPNAEAVLFLDHWGSPKCVGSPFTVRRNSRELIVISAEEEPGQTTVILDGKTVLNCQSGMYPQSMNRQVLARNTIGFTTAAASFSGSVQWAAAQENR